MLGSFLAMSFSRTHHDDGHGWSARAGFALDRDGKGFGFGVRRQRRINDGCRAVGIGLEDSGGNGIALRRNQPQLVRLLRRQSGEIVGDQHQLAGVAEIEDSALRLGGDLYRDERHPLGSRGTNWRQDPHKVFEFAGVGFTRCGDGIEALPEDVVGLPEDAGQDHGGGSDDPPEPSPGAGSVSVGSFLGLGSLRRILRDGIEEALAGSSGGTRADGGDGEQGSVAAELFELAAAIGTGGEMRLELGAVVALELV